MKVVLSWNGLLFDPAIHSIPPEYLHELKTVVMHPLTGQAALDWWASRTAPEAERMAWVPVSKDDQRFVRSDSVALHRSHYANAVRSNGEGYDCFVISLPPLPRRR